MIEYSLLKAHGEMSEWSKEHAWKACIRATVSRVQIPFSPPEKTAYPIGLSGFFMFFTKCLNLDIFGKNTAP